MTRKRKCPVNINWRLKKINDKQFQIQIKSGLFDLFWKTKMINGEPVICESVIEANYWLKVRYPYSSMNQLATV